MFAVVNFVLRRCCSVIRWYGLQRAVRFSKARLYVACKVGFSYGRLECKTAKVRKPFCDFAKQHAEFFACCNVCARGRRCKRRREVAAVACIASNSGEVAVELRLCPGIARTLRGCIGALSRRSLRAGGALYALRSLGADVSLVSFRPLRTRGSGFTRVPLRTLWAFEGGKLLLCKVIVSKGVALLALGSLNPLRAL